MSDIVEVTEDRITRMVNGANRVFILINAYDRGEILRADLKRRRERHAERRARLLENLKLAGITGDSMFAELHNLDQQFPEDTREQNWFDWLNDPTNDVELFTVSLRKTYPGDASELAKLVVLPLEDKAKISGVRLVDKPTASPENPDPNSRTPAVYSMTPEAENSTGARPSAESGTGSPA